MVKMPILLNGNAVKGIVRPLSMGQQWRIDSLSSVSMELDDESPEVSVGDRMRVWAPNGLNDVFYVKSIKQDKVTGRKNVNMEHVAGLLGGMVIFGEKKPGDMGGGSSTVTTQAAITYLLSQQTETLFTLHQNDFASVSQGWKFTNSTIQRDLQDIAEAIQDCQWEYDTSGNLPYKMSLKAWPVSATMEMRLSRNISTMKVTVDRSNMYTRCYPTGKNNKHIDSVNGGVSYLDRNTSTWGVVAQVITDSSIGDPALLKAWGEKQLKKNAEPSVTVSISGVELSMSTGESMDRIVPGRMCRVPLPRYGTTITERVTELNWKDVMVDEEGVTVTMANEHKTIAGVLNEKASGGGGGGKKSNTEHDCALGDDQMKIEEFENSDIWINRENIWLVAGAYTVTTDAQGRHIRLKDGSLLEVKRDGIYETVGTAAAIGEVQDGVDLITGSALWTGRDHITGITGEFIKSGDTLTLVDGAELKVTKDGIASTVGTVSEIEGVSGRVSTIEGSALWTQRSGITAVAGKFTVSGDTVSLVDGASLRVKKDGVYSTVGTVSEISDVQDSVDGVSGRVSTIEGSALWTQRSGITAVAGKFTVSGDTVSLVDGASLRIKKDGVYSTVGTVSEISDVQDSVDGVSGRVTSIEGSALWTGRDGIVGVTGLLEKDSSGNLVVKDGAGLYVQRGSAKLGVYDSGNLTGGILVSKLNDGGTSVKIKADLIELDGAAVASSLEGQSIGAGSIQVYDLEVDRSFYCEASGAFEGSCHASSFTAGDGRRTLNIADASVSNNTLTITKVDGTTINFSKAHDITVSGASVTDSAPGGTAFGTLQNVVTGAMTNPGTYRGRYCTFTVNCGGTTKRYYFRFGY